MRNCSKIQNTIDLCKDIYCSYCVPGMCWGLEIWWQRRQSRSPALKEKEAINLRNGIVSAMGA